MAYQKRPKILILELSLMMLGFSFLIFFDPHFQIVKTFSFEGYIFDLIRMLVRSSSS